MVNLTSVSGAKDELQITVGHGAIDYLELDASSTSITADDRIYINTTGLTCVETDCLLCYPLTTGPDLRRSVDARCTCHLGSGENGIKDS